MNLLTSALAFSPIAPLPLQRPARSSAPVVMASPMSPITLGGGAVAAGAASFYAVRHPCRPLRPLRT